MKTREWKLWGLTFLRVACGLVLIHYSVGKLWDPKGFTGSVEGFHVLPLALVPIAAVVIPWLEFIAGACLMLGIRWRAAALVFCAFMVIYTLALTWNLAHGVVMDCGCSGTPGEKATWFTVLRDIGFLAMGLPVLLASQTRASLEPLSGKNKP